jgi:hypothetical protein
MGEGDENPETTEQMNKIVSVRISAGTTTT